ncbi:hypothetical protein DL766_007267 [Monosporascus sp. MC13-8B]|uniref:Ecp2 effector protein domain-containing protein n=1 Tax=Monosporascus cannonballus TaxID=155416 RepID=A0ABY0H202_9PEZI|nr:hypothetical protein DL762_006827 [Monosporascus cannonballus]RYO83368.1 hypothetical protein DL763_007903 [Monosporascus cannonballus]RYP24573.1 hypothetical protein DL766_007267 [Monosporascus sp. MC13-8B]
MQFSTLLATVMAVAAGANAVAVGTRQEALATLQAYNFSTCDVDAVLTVDITDFDCHDFEQSYGNAQAALANPEANCMLTLYSERGCNGEIYWAKPGTCPANIDGIARWSYALTCAE